MKEEKKKKTNNETEEKNQKLKGKKSEKAVLTITVVAILLVLGLIAFVLNTIIMKVNYISKNPIATMVVRDMGTIKIELYPNYAPNTVTNFIALANNGFYNELTFHRTIPEFMIQGGDPNGDGTGNATLKDIGEEEEDAYCIKGEFILNGFSKNTLKHEKGVISMARSDYSQISDIIKKGYNSASCQFFITTADSNTLDGSYAAFGKVIEGMDIVEKIANVEVETRESGDEELTQDKPVNPPVIESITVETFGIDYGKPETEEPFNISDYLNSQYASSY